MVGFACIYFIFKNIFDFLILGILFLQFFGFGILEYH
jgi:hypothetical protein